MISEKELRIGNYLFDNLGRIISIHEIRLEHLKFCLSNGSEIKHNIKSFKPIPLNEEWLLKLGFEKGNDFYGDCFYIEREKEDFVLHIEKDCFSFFYELVEIKYLHQFQNLYFALTNEELTLKL